MKKMYYLMTAVIVALAFNACSTNDNPITPSTQSGRAVITLNTAAMYEEVGIAAIIERNLNKLLCIADTVLIYDQNGRLVNKLGTMTKSLEPQTFEFNDLPNGTYTLGCQEPVPWHQLRSVVATLTSSKIKCTSEFLNRRSQ